jgi:CRP-like cAMP-binding protein
VIARIAWGIGWICLVLFLALRAVGVKLSEVFGSQSYWTQVGAVFGLLSILAILLYLGRPIFRVLLWRAKYTFRQLKTVWARWRVNKVEPSSPDQLNRLFSESLLFRRLPPAERAQLLAVAQTRVFKPYTNIHNFGDKATEVGVIVSGRATVSRRLKSGRAERIISLREGDVFGAHALLDVDRPEALVRTVTPLVALMIPIAEFEKRVIPAVGTALANDLVQKTPFLRDLPFCANWHPQAVARFAQLASVVSYSENEVIVADRQDSQQFFVVYEGRVIVKREGKVRSRLKAGAFFGEIGLLQNSAAVSDVVAKEWTRCLTISKADFLRFVTHNPIVGLQLESISSKRLGRPIFPLAARSFDVR